MLTKQRQEIIEQEYKRLSYLWDGKKGDINETINKCNEKEVILLRFLYTTMPLNDIADTKAEIFLDYVKHGITLWEQVEWVKSLPEDIFLNYVLYHRINEEDISTHRSLFYQEICDRIKGMSVKEAALEVNYWCASHVTYHTTDERCVSPMTAYTSGFGRCGEESTFTVSALRSVGIPARQVYAPRWAHCDDNHAWAEIWIDGIWYFMGACEPEPVMNRGWFTNASSRAMMIHGRTFDKVEGDEIINKEGPVYFVNTLDKYASTAEIKILVEDTNHRPLEDAQVQIQLLNYSEFAVIAEQKTKNNGCAAFKLGLGSIQIHVSHKGKYETKLVDTRSNKLITITMDVHKNAFDQWEKFDYYAPKDQVIHGGILDSEQKVQAQVKLEKAIELRKEKTESFYKDQEAIKLKKTFGLSNDILQILRKSMGNFNQVRDFIMTDLGEEKNALKEPLLLALTSKDYQDLKSDVLIEELLNTGEGIKPLEKPFGTVPDGEGTVPNEIPNEIIYSYLLNPRIHMEPMTAYRKFIGQYFEKSIKDKFIKNPKNIWKYITENIGDLPEKDFKQCYISPVGSLTLGLSSNLSKKILFVAICRTLWIPARLNPMDLSMEYYKENEFISVEKGEEKECKIILKSQQEKPLLYEQTFTIGKLNTDGCFETLKLLNAPWKSNELSFIATPGQYRIITSNRLPNGNIFAAKYEFQMESGQEKMIELLVRDANIEDMLESLVITDFQLFEEDNTVINASDVLGPKKTLVAWIEEGKEPTEHLLNEMYDCKEQFCKQDFQIIFIMKDKKSLQDALLNKVLRSIPDIQIYYDSFTENVNTLGRRMYVDPDKLPLVIVTNEGLNGMYACSGYNVGIAEMLLKVLA